MIFNDNWRKIKKLRGEKNEGSAKDLGITISALSNYENDYTEFQEMKQKKIANYYKNLLKKYFFK